MTCRVAVMQRSHCPEHDGRCRSAVETAEQHLFSVLYARESYPELDPPVRDRSETSLLDNPRRLRPYRDKASTRRAGRTEQSDLSREGRTPRRRSLPDNTALRASR